MASEGSNVDASGKTIGERVIERLDALHRRYSEFEETARRYTPRIVRGVEVVLGAILLTVLTYWLYSNFLVG